MLRMEGKRNSPAAPLRESKSHSSHEAVRPFLQRNRSPVLFAYLTADFSFLFLRGN